MSDAYNLGQEGENLAVDFLKRKGYKIHFRNWKWGKHEIDIIAEKDNKIVFIEVKTRTGEFLGGLGSAVSKEKQNSIIRAAEGYIKRFNIDKESRFDVLAIIKTTDNQTFDHIEDAFYPTLR